MFPVLIIGPLTVHALLELLFESYLVTLFISFFPKILETILRPLIIAFLYIITIIELFCYHNLNSAISSTLLRIMLQTNKQEATEALNAYVSLNAIPFYIWIIISSIPVIILSSFIIKKWGKNIIRSIKSILPFFHRGLSYLLVGIILFSFSFSIKNELGLIQIIATNDSNKAAKINDWLPTGFYLPTWRLLRSIATISKDEHEVELLMDASNHIQIEDCRFTSPNIILIIGESHNKYHSSLYGYQKSTSPFQMEMEKKGNLVLFTNVVASWNFTYSSLKNIFSLYGYGDQGEWYQYPVFQELFKRSGYKVFFISNEYQKNLTVDALWLGSGAFFDQEYFSNAMFTHRNHSVHKYDEGLLHDYDSLKVFKGKNNLIIFHLLGQHQKYEERFPSNFKIFTPDDYNLSNLSLEEKRILASYDNATLYNDYILHKIISLYENENAIVVYFPDHGESCFDEGSKLFGRKANLDKHTAKYQYEIPFWIYASDDYQSTHPDIWQSVIQAKDKKFMTDNISHLLLHLAGIRCKYYQEKNDLLSSQYNENRPRMLKGEKDYDILMSK